MANTTKGGVFGTAQAGNPNIVQGETGATGPQGLQGIAGDDGRGIVSVVRDLTYDPNAADIRLTITYTDSTIANILVPKGTVGAQGLPGAPGDKGDTGDAGPTGAKGNPGVQGPAGPTGGLGPAGPRGDTGATGAAGPQGAAGSIGDPGPEGPVGPAGPGGADGSKGDKGDPGIQGIPGATGATGKEVNDITYNSVSQQLVFTYNDSTNDFVDIAGLQGDKGDDGEDGISGINGDSFRIAYRYFSESEQNAFGFGDAVGSVPAENSVPEDWFASPGAAGGAAGNTLYISIGTASSTNISSYFWTSPLPLGGGQVIVQEGGSGVSITVNDQNQVVAFNEEGIVSFGENYIQLGTNTTASASVTPTNTPSWDQSLTGFNISVMNDEKPFEEFITTLHRVFWNGTQINLGSAADEIGGNTGSATDAKRLTFTEAHTVTQSADNPLKNSVSLGSPEVDNILMLEFGLSELDDNGNSIASTDVITTAVNVRWTGLQYQLSIPSKTFRFDGKETSFSVSESANGEDPFAHADPRTVAFSTTNGGSIPSHSFSASTGKIDTATITYDIFYDTTVEADTDATFTRPVAAGTGSATLSRSATLNKTIYWPTWVILNADSDPADISFGTPTNNGYSNPTGTDETQSRFTDTNKNAWHSDDGQASANFGQAGRNYSAVNEGSSPLYLHIIAPADNVQWSLPGSFGAKTTPFGDGATELTLGQAGHTETYYAYTFEVRANQFTQSDPFRVRALS